ncbi:MAG: ScyD/ScyE family protein [Bryobacteraceae bacterium]|nr:ScyD/ScyE family protein [Bryobacteraceae bacterium]
MQRLDVPRLVGRIAKRLPQLVRLPTSEPDPNTVYRFSNPWGLALADEGATLYAVDASMNALLRIDTATGRWRRIVRFPPAPNPGPVGPPVIDAVPTSVRPYGQQLLVSFLTGFPFIHGAARVLAVNPAERTSEPFMFGLTTIVDVLWRPTGGPRPQFFALEFSQNMTAQPPGPGRLLRFDTPEAQVVAADLRGPVSLALDPASNFLYVLELSGRLLRLPSIDADGLPPDDGIAGALRYFASA